MGIGHTTTLVKPRNNQHSLETKEGSSYTGISSVSTKNRVIPTLKNCREDLRVLRSKLLIKIFLKLKFCGKLSNPVNPLQLVKTVLAMLIDASCICTDS